MPAGSGYFPVLPMTESQQMAFTGALQTPLPPMPVTMEDYRRLIQATQSTLAIDRPNSPSFAALESQATST